MSTPGDSPTEEIPPVPSPPNVDAGARAEATSTFDVAKLDFNLRRAAAYGALGVAAMLYLIGIAVLLKQMGMAPWECEPLFEVTSASVKTVDCAKSLSAMREGWHSFLAAMIALFSVPTVLVISVLRSAAARKDPGADSAYTVLGEKLASVIEKWVTNGNAGK